MLDYDWPGNVRELENAIYKALLLAENTEINLPQYQKKNKSGLASKGLFKSLEDVEKEYIEKVLKHCNGKISGENGASEILGLKRTTLLYRMNKLGIIKP